MVFNKILVLFLLLPILAFAQADSIAPDQTNISTLTAAQFLKGIRIGWNVGNSLEAGLTNNGVYAPSETAWGNPVISQRLIDSVKSAGFNAIRIPVAWGVYSNAATWTIQSSWLDRVQTVVDYAINRGMYVVLNEHWDGGWLNQPTYANQTKNNNQLKAIWKQVAIRFRNYGDHLLFAGTNEVMMENFYGTPTTEYIAVQQSYLQTFINTVRSTGGRNAYRYLVVQSFNTDINHAVSYFQKPTDRVSNRLILEVHYYDPWEFTIAGDNTVVTQWGASGQASKKATWDSDESHVDAQFAKLKSKFIDQGLPVILGEYSAMLKNNTDNPPFRLSWNRYVTQAAIRVGMVPFYWDPGFTTVGSSGLFNRTTGQPVHQDVISAMMSVAPSVPISSSSSQPLSSSVLISSSNVPSSSSVVSQQPYQGVIAIPGTIQAENYDLGGEGQAYHDNDAINSGNVYRTDGVDITGDATSGYKIGWTMAGEWLEYTVQITQAGVYNWEASVSSGNATSSFRMTLNGSTDLTGLVTVPNTGSWDTYTTITGTTPQLPAGTHVLRLAIEGAYCNIDWIRFGEVPTPLLNHIKSSGSKVQLPSFDLIGRIRN